MDEAGWVSVEELLKAAAGQGRRISREDIDEVISQSDKRRFSFSSDGKFIRANYGHSIDIKPDYESVQPPEILFHGTARRFLSRIRDEGLHSQNRQFVHLSTDRKSAINVGRRHGKPVVLKIAARNMYKNDYTFFPSDASIWLTRLVPADYIIFHGFDEE